MINTRVRGLTSVIGLFFVTTLFAVYYTFRIHNDCIKQEATLEEQYEQNKSNYFNYLNKLNEAAQVPEMYATDLQKVYINVVRGRYEDSRPVIQFVAAHNPNFDSALYVKLQSIIESGMDSFEADYQALLDKKRVYEVTLNTFPNGMIAKLLGYPKKNINEFDIINEETELIIFPVLENIK